MLHAASITFVHPVTKEELTFETPAEFENNI
jgi:23S rRNA-/tRNA-specific pseudouridylate synthase